MPKRSDVSSSRRDTVLRAPDARDRPERRPLRRDAERNRQRILETAARVIGARGLDISHDEIAREAKVGVGTVYRRFPTREALFDAVYEQQLEAMVAVAEAAAEREDPWEALEFFFVRTFEEQAANHGLRQLLIGHSGGTELARSAQSRISPIVASLVERAHRAGDLKSSVAATDVAMIPVMINAIMRASRDVDPELWRRWLVILLEGLACGPRRTELPGQAPDAEQVVRIIGGKSKPPGGN